MRSVGIFGLTTTCESKVLGTVESSTLDTIPPGARIRYAYNGDGSDRLAYPTIKVKGGSTTGLCNWNQPPGLILAKCGFGGGTGRLAGFELAVDVTVDGDPDDPAAVWHWDGVYGFGHAH
jgi:hypothetical protein